MRKKEFRDRIQICPDCKSDQTTRAQTFVARGNDFTKTTRVYHCFHCGNEFEIDQWEYDEDRTEDNRIHWGDE